MWNLCTYVETPIWTRENPWFFQWWKWIDKNTLELGKVLENPTRTHKPDQKPPITTKTHKIHQNTLKNQKPREPKASCFGRPKLLLWPPKACSRLCDSKVKSWREDHKGDILRHFWRRIFRLLAKLSRTLIWHLN